MRKWMSAFLSICILMSSLTGPVYGSESKEIDAESSIIEDVIEKEESADSEITDAASGNETSGDMSSESNEEDSAVEDESSVVKSEENSEEVSEENAEESSEESSEEPADDSESIEYGPDDRTQEIIDLQNEILSYEDIASYGVANLEYEEQLISFPESYRPYIEALHEKYPNWGFQAIETGLDWNDAVLAESSNDRSLIYYSADELLRSNASGDYDVSTGKYIAKDGTLWFAASRSAVAYFMDPRNFLNEQYIMMFEANSFDQAYQTKDGVEAILNGTFMSNTAIDYLDADGNTIELETTYGETIWTAGGMANVSPLYLASKIRQEIGTTKSASVAGDHETYPGIYNYYNIGAYSSSDPVSNGLKWASLEDQNPSYQRPWTSPVLSIYGGAEYIGQQYILKGQNTGYFMRFNVSPERYYSAYDHQYMTNISGAASEAYSTYKSYVNLGILEDAKVFYIPVYENMPDKSVEIAIEAPVETGSIEYAVNLRDVPTTDNSYSSVLVTAEAGTELTILGGDIWSSHYTSSMLVYPYWYKVQFTQNGEEYTGYMSAEYVDLDTAYTLTVGATQQLQLSSGDTETVYYETSDPAVVTVDDNGVITAVGEGKATVYAISGSGKMDAVGVEVTGEKEETVVYTVTFNANGGTVGTTSVDYEEGDVLGTLPTATRNDYVFQGWYTEKSGGTKVTDSDEVSEAITLYAQWKKNISASTITISTIKNQAFKNAAIKPSVAIKDGSTTLVNGTHYTVSYKNNKLPGTATVTIKGTGNYTGSRTVTFKIVETLVSYKTTANLNYRSGAGTSYAKVGTIAKGKTVKVVSGVSKKANGYTWYLIKLNSKYYYVASTYLSKITTSTETLVNYKTTANLNYRSGAGTSYSKVGTIAKGTTVKVVSGYSKKANGYTWYKIKLNSKYYYVVSSYLKKVSTTTTTTTTETLISYTTSANLNYRKGPGTSYSIVGTLKKGSSVKVVSGYSKKANGYTWYKIKISGKYYYAVSAYLKK